MQSCSFDNVGVLCSLSGCLLGDIDFIFCNISGMAEDILEIQKDMNSTSLWLSKNYTVKNIRFEITVHCKKNKKLFL